MYPTKEGLNTVHGNTIWPTTFTYLTSQLPSFPTFVVILAAIRVLKVHLVEAFCTSSGSAFHFLEPLYARLLLKFSVLGCSTFINFIELLLVETPTSLVCFRLLCTRDLFYIKIRRCCSLLYLYLRSLAALCSVELVNLSLFSAHLGPLFCRICSFFLLYQLVPVRISITLNSIFSYTNSTAFSLRKLRICINCVNFAAALEMTCCTCLSYLS